MPLRFIEYHHKMTVQSNATFADNFFKLTIENYADLVALIDPDTDESFTFNELQTRTVNYIQSLEAIGITKGDVVGTFVGNSVEFLVFCLAVNQLGAILCPLNPGYKAAEFEHYFLQAKVKWVLTELEFVKKLKASKVLMDNIKSLILLPDSDNNNEDRDKIRHIKLSKTSAEIEKYVWPNKEIHYDDDAVIFFSSGTTGPPKAIMLSQKSLNAYLTLITTLKDDTNSNFVTLSNEDTVYGVLPYFHAGGLLTTFIMLAQGAKVLVNRRFHEDEFLENVSKYQVSVLLLVPPILEFLCYTPKVDPFKLTSLKYMFVGAAKVRPEHEDMILKRIPSLNQVLQLYGSTEAGVLVFMMSKKASLFGTKNGSTGLPLPGVEAKVSQSPSLEYSSNYQYGELLLKTTTQMSRYLEDEDPENSSFDEDGYLKTGDLARVDSDGFYFIVGRVKELIKVRGWQVSPYELEEALRKRFTAIVDIGIVGIPADVDGEHPTAVIVLAPGTMLCAGEVEQFVEDNFVSYKKLKGGVNFCDKLPKTPSGKLDRPELVRMLMESPSDDEP